MHSAPHSDPRRAGREVSGYQQQDDVRKRPLKPGTLSPGQAAAGEQMSRVPKHHQQRTRTVIKSRRAVVRVRCYVAAMRSLGYEVTGIPEGRQQEVHDKAG